jgi:hypothetical protein
MEGLSNVLSVLIPFGFLAAVVLSLFFYFRATNQIRMTLIEKGLYTATKPRTSKGNGSLKLGIFFIGLSLGIFMGYLLGKFTPINGIVSFFSMILLFGGVSLVVNQFIGAKLNKADE